MVLRNIFRLAFIQAISVLAAVSGATTWYVSPTGNDANAGTSAGAPFQTIQRGINIAVLGDTVKLLPGTYSGAGNVSSSVPTSYLTITSTAGAGSTIIDGGGSAVLAVSGLGFQLSGVTIQNSDIGLNIANSATVSGCIFNASGIFVGANGNLTLSGCSVVQEANVPALRNAGTSTIKNCLFDSNAKGAVLNIGQLIVQGSTFNNNTRFDNVGGGGAISSLSNSQIAITDSEFDYNYAAEVGGAIDIETSLTAPTATIIRCKFKNNAANGDGGAIYGTVPVNIQGCTFSGNTSFLDGGAISFAQTLNVTNCVFQNNSSGEYGGAIELYDGPVSFTNCLFTGNVAQLGTGGGAIDDFIASGDLNIRSCTFSRNVTDGAGGAIFQEPQNTSNLNISNCIFWGDTAAQGNEISVTAPLQITVQYCDVQGGFSGTAIINQDPRFVSATGSDFHLTPGSPCFGTATPILDVFTDLDSNPRHANPTIGAYETLAGGSVWAPVDAAVGADGQDRVLWSGINSLSGYTLLWRVANPGGPTYHVFPTAGYTPLKIASGPNGHDRMLLTSANGSVLLYDIASDFSITNYRTYGPLPGWTPVLMSVDANNNVVLTWRNVSGQVAVWSIATNGAVSYSSFGPYNDGSGNQLWSVVGAGVTPGGVDVLWSGQNALLGDILLYRAGGVTYNVYGPFTAWNPALFAVGPNGHEKVLLNDGAHDAVLWDVASNFSLTYTAYGPFAVWTPMSLTVDSNNNSHIMWVSANGTVLLWTINSNGSIVYGVYGPF
ncbi:MAG: hypothetical protein JSS72_09970 [Armatimonadetes bacterium]|nr:hypothetical protein [Armatimonadota bacterium]